MSFPNWRGAAASSGDNQTLSFDPASDTLSISNGNSVVITPTAPTIISLADLNILDGATASITKGTLSAPGAGAVVTLNAVAGSTVKIDSVDQSIEVGAGQITTQVSATKFMLTSVNAAGNNEIADLVSPATFQQTIEFAPTEIVIDDALRVKNLATLPSIAVSPLKVDLADGTGGIATVQLNQVTKDIELLGFAAPGGQLTALKVTSAANVVMPGNANVNSLTSAGTGNSSFNGPVTINSATAFLSCTPNVNDVIAFTTPVSATFPPYQDIVIPNVFGAGMIRVEYIIQITTGFVLDFYSPAFITYQCGTPAAPALGAFHQINMDTQRIQGATNQNRIFKGTMTFVRNLDYDGNAVNITITDAAFPGGGSLALSIFDVQGIF